MEEIARHDLDDQMPPGWTLTEHRGRDYTEYSAEHESFVDRTTSPQASTAVHRIIDNAIQEAHKRHEKLMPKQSKPTAVARRDATPAGPRQIWDAETEAMVTITDDQVQRYIGMQRIVEMSDVAKAVALKHIADEKLYLAGGFSSFKEYSETALPFGYRSAQYYVQVGRKFAPLLPGLDAEETNPGSLLPEHIDDSGRLEGVEGLGIRKLRELTKVEDAVFEDIVEKGELVMPDGETRYTLDDLKAMKSKEVAKLVEQARMERDAYRARIRELEEEKKLIESERKADAEKIEQADRKLEEAKELERLYTTRNVSYESNKKLLEDARDAAFELRRRLFNAEVTDESAQGLKNLLAETVREIGAIFNEAQDFFYDALLSATDTFIVGRDYDRKLEESPTWQKLMEEAQMDPEELASSNGREGA